MLSLALSTLMMAGSGLLAPLEQCQAALAVCLADGPVPLAGRWSSPDLPRYYLQAVEQLRSATSDLSKCASRKDPESDCSREFRDVRDAFDEYEQAADQARAEVR